MRRVFAVTLVILAACGYPKAEGERLSNEMHAVQSQASAMQQALSELQELTKKQSEQLAKLDREVGQLNSAARRNDADLGVQLDEARQQVARMKGLVESSQERLSNVESAVSKVQEELDIRFNSLNEAQRHAQKTQAEKEKAAAEAARLERLLSSPSALFEEVGTLMKNDRAAEARKLLREFTIRAKDDKKQAPLLADALFFIGETFFAEGNFQQAAAEFNNVRKNHPKSPKVPEALYKLGQCFEKLSLPDDARLFYTTVVKNHPKSAAAKDAKARLDALK